MIQFKTFLIINTPGVTI